MQCACTVHAACVQAEEAGLLKVLEDAPALTMETISDVGRLFMSLIQQRLLSTYSVPCTMLVSCRRNKNAGHLVPVVKVLTI